MNANRPFVFAASAAALLALAACHGGSGGGGDDGRVVYVAGGITDAQGVTRATLWENGTPRRLSQRHSEACSVCASGGVVYVAGNELDAGGGYRPVLWRNGAAQYLPSESPYAQATSVHVSDGRVCVAGCEMNFDFEAGFDILLTAKTWVDGQGRSLGSGQADSVFVSGGAVYAAGFDFSSASIAPRLWKDGAPQALAPISDWGMTYAHSVFVSGEDVYVAGTDSTDVPHAVLWENGLARLVGDQDRFGSEAHSVFVSGGDVYVAGAVMDAHYSGLPTVWRNGNAQRLGSAGDAWALSVFVTPDGDVYAAGVEYDAQDMSRPRLWKNGVAQGLGGETPDSTAYSVFVVDVAE